MSFSGGSSKVINGGGEKDLRITFSIKQWDLQSPNQMHARVWNPSVKTMAQFKNKEFTDVEFSGGYEDNVGVIFKGTIKQSIAGHENATDTFVDIFAADGEYSYNQARLSTTLAAGHTPQDRINAALKSMQPFGTTMGLVNVDLSQPKFPRGLPLVGMTRELIRMTSLSLGANWSLQQNKLHIIDQRKDVPGNTVKLTAQTGLIGWPRQSQSGIETVSLLNPKLQPHVNIELDPSQIIAAQQNINVRDPNSARQNQELENQNLGAGIYNIYLISRQGDSRGAEWYDNAVSIGKGGSLPSSMRGYSLGQS